MDFVTYINILLLIVSDYQDSNLAIASNPFLSKCSPIILKICALLLSLKNRSFNISFLWDIGHIGINGNEHVDLLGGSTANKSSLGPLWCPYTVLITLHRSSIQELWQLEWDTLPEPCALG